MVTELDELAAEHDLPPSDIYRVSDLNTAINNLFETAPDIASIHVLGEVSNISTAASGHYFFDLKDAEAKISCVLFADRAADLGYELEDGDSILVEGTAEYYEKTGRASLKIYQVIPVGDGKYHAEIRKRKKRLAADGLFDDKHKSPVPRIPEQVGIVTSKHGAAVEDMINAIHGRYPQIDIHVKHADVQGSNAVDDLIAGLEYFDRETAVDVILIGRGGGSIEDLDAFNQEALVRTIFDCDTPVVSGVGHRTDDTITGLVADHRAITPTAAGEHVAPRRTDLVQDLDRLEDRLETAYDRFQKSKQQETRITQAASRERIYQATIVILLLIILLQSWVIL